MLVSQFIRVWKDNALPQITMRSINIFCEMSNNLKRILCCDNSLESSVKDDSNDWSHHKNRLRNKKVSKLKYIKAHNIIEYNVLSVSCRIANEFSAILF